jgi:integrase
MLKPQNFDLHGQSILIDRNVAKNKRTMGVALPDVLMPYLHALELQKQRPDHYVFSKEFQPGTDLKDSRYSGKAWDRMRRRIGLSKEVTNYQLKHAGGEQLSRDGVSAVDLMNHLRHQDLKETTTYTKRASRGGVRDVIHKASAF